MQKLFTGSQLSFAGAIAAAVLLVGGSTLYLNLNKVEEADAFHCSPDRFAPAHVAIVIDATDRLTPDQAKRLLSTAGAAARSLPRHGRLTLLLIRPDSPWEPEEVLSLCSPGRGSEVNELNETPALIERAWRKAFLAPLETAAAQLTGLPAGEESPVLQSLSAIASRRDFSAEAPRRTLIYIGDGLQHTPGVYSHYRDGDPVDTYRASGLASELDPDFSGATIEIDYMRRPLAAGAQGARHKAFWRWWFSDHGAIKVTVRGG